MREIPALRERDSGFPTTNVTNEIVRAVNQMAPIIQTGQAGEPSLPSIINIRFVRVNSAATRGSGYHANVLTPKSDTPIDMTASGEIEESDLFDTAEACYLVNSVEIDHDSHGVTDVAAGRIFIAMRHPKLATDGLPIYVGVAFGWVPCG
jgi:hypothetical protein